MSLVTILLLLCINAVLSRNEAFALVGSSSSSSIPPPKIGSESSVGEQIQRASTIEDLLQAATNLWLPTDHDLPSYLRIQRVHQEKRLRWSSQLVGKMGTLALSPKKKRTQVKWSDPRMERALLAASIPFDTDRGDKQGRYLKEALVGLYSLLGSNSMGGPVTDQILEGISTIFRRAENLALHVTLPEALEMRWACGGILSYLSTGTRQNSAFVSLQIPPTLEKRTAHLPFDILAACVNWDKVLPDALDRFKVEIPFQFDTIVTRGGAAVTERRRTAWIANDGIGALAYSGKIMEPHPIPTVVKQIMEIVEDHVFENGRLRPFFDCALCNHYPTGESACKFHTDPEHGSHWDRLTCVVAVGQPRRFAFRPIPGVSSWSDWELEECTGTLGDEHVPAVIPLFAGDVVKMHSTCNDDFHHAVYPQQPNGSDDDLDDDDDERISLVFKRALARNGKRKGHGKTGEGRRSRRRNILPVP